MTARVYLILRDIVIERIDMNKRPLVALRILALTNALNFMSRADFDEGIRDLKRRKIITEHRTINDSCYDLKLR